MEVSFSSLQLENSTQPASSRSGRHGSPLYLLSDGMLGRDDGAEVVGDALNSTVGSEDGWILGSEEGILLGAVDNVGIDDGETDGDREGAWDGDAVGRSMLPPHAQQASDTVLPL